MADIIEAIEQVRHVLGDMPLEAFEAEWEKQWLVERGVEIISEAGHHLPDDLKIRNPEIPWKKVAGVGNLLRHDYESIAAPVMWKLAHEDLFDLERVCATNWKPKRNVGEMDVGQGDRSGQEG
ncbi:HepT-like ribonuclease domain-containing protein [Methylocystis sp.]|uniref:HepT-like ribonuclease domain-containing protein n=1 Tax=Methylocystis sp. TaxID=1911079 RepID=UPI0025F92E2E|nr:HepT-like ribonuclease domain-containing protein [Methylocystis sp.]